MEFVPVPKIYDFACFQLLIGNYVVSRDDLVALSSSIFAWWASSDYTESAYLHLLAQDDWLREFPR
jgi:hypothetical protein